MISIGYIRWQNSTWYLNRLVELPKSQAVVIHIPNITDILEELTNKKQSWTYEQRVRARVCLFFFFFLNFIQKRFRVAPWSSGVYM